jgi:hypothetical protein
MKGKTTIMQQALGGQNIPTLDDSKNDKDVKPSNTD